MLQEVQQLRQASTAQQEAIAVLVAQVVSDLTTVQSCMRDSVTGNIGQFACDTYQCQHTCVYVATDGTKVQAVRGLVGRTR